MSKEALPIKNFRRVNDWFYRGGQPTVDQLPLLVEAGFKTIVCLRWNASAIEAERQKAIELGFNFIYLPLSYWILPTQKEIETYFEIIDNESMRPVFLHCKHGSDRTGMLVTFYRMAREGWTADEAYKEMKDAGFHKIRMHHFKWAVYRFERKLKKSKS